MRLGIVGVSWLRYVGLISSWSGRYLVVNMVFLNLGSVVTFSQWGIALRTSCHDIPQLRVIYRHCCFQFFYLQTTTVTMDRNTFC